MTKHNRSLRPKGNWISRRIFNLVAGVRLRTLVFISGVLLAVLGVTASVTVLAITDRMEEEAEQIRARVTARIAAENLGINLLVHARSDFLSHVSDERAPHLAKMMEAETNIGKRLSELESATRVSGETDFFETIRARVVTYLDAHREANRDRMPPIEAYQNAAVLVQEIGTEVNNLVESRSELRETKWMMVSQAFSQIEIVSSLSALVVVIIIAIIFVSARTVLYHPLLALQRAIRRFRDGDLSARADAQGTVDLQEIADVFNGMADDLVRRQNTRLNFLSAVAHDLRNPLGAVTMSTELLIADPDVSIEERTQMLEVIRRQAKYLNRMVGDLLDTTRIEAGTLALRRAHTDLTEVARESVSLFQSVSKAHAIALSRAESAVAIECDRVRMSQVINNLISNAIKYSPQGGRVTVTVENLDGHAVITVSDQGLGIATDDLQRIFEPFRRSSKPNESIPGVGLGLSVAKRIIEAHGGSIVVESVLSLGSKFTIRLPVADGKTIELASSTDSIRSLPHRSSALPCSLQIHG